MSKAALLIVLGAWCGSASAVNTCRLGLSGGLAFGGYDVVSTLPNDSLASVDVTCSRDGGPQFVTVQVGLGAGTHATSVNARRMAHTGGLPEYLNYNLYRDVSRTSVWGFSQGTNTASRTVQVPNKSSTTVAFTIYGRIPAQQDVPAGSYADAVQVTVTP